MSRTQVLTDNRKSFDEVVAIGNGLIDPRKPEFQGRLHVGPDNISSESGRIIYPLQTARELGLKSGKFPFESGDILYSKIRPNLNKVAIADVDGICSADMYVLKPKGIDRSFLFHSLRGELFYKQAVAASMRSGLPKVNRDDLSMMELKVPSPPEQRRIAAILDEWDKAIAATEKLVDAKKDRKRAISQRLFAQTQPRSASNWRLVTFDELFKEFERPNSDQGASVITVGKYAIRPQSEHFNNSVSSKDLTGYKVINRGDFVYDPMSAYYGAIGRYDLDTVGVVSPAYRTLHITELWTSDFAVYALDTEFIRFQLEARSSQGNKDGKRRVLQREEFGAIEIRLPDIEQQRQFASLMSSAEQDLKYQIGLRDQLRLQKRGLMQKLLSGDWPVPVSIDRLLPGGQDIEEVVGAEVKRAEAAG